MKRTATIYQSTPLSVTNGEPASPVRRRAAENSPRESVIRNLLNYSKALAVLQTRETGFINLVMN